MKKNRKELIEVFTYKLNHLNEQISYSIPNLEDEKDELKRTRAALFFIRCDSEKVYKLFYEKEFIETILIELNDIKGIKSESEVDNEANEIISYKLDRLEGMVFSNPIKHSTNEMINISSIWELEVNLKLIQFIKRFV